MGTMETGVAPEVPHPDVLTALRRDRHESLDALVPIVYEELRFIARRHLARHRGAGEPTLETAGLVNEVYLKLVDQSRADWRDRAHFLAIASVAMRHILIDRARTRARDKRGGENAVAVTLDEAVVGDESPEALLEIDEALDRLARLDPRLARVVECRFFGGLSETEVAEALGMTVRTVQRDWAKARLLLRQALQR
jgi:RNA polymerase sigma factor (TIGR02999 family)